MAETAHSGGLGGATSSSDPGAGTDVKGQAQEVKEQAKEQAQQVKEQAKEQAQQVWGQGRGRLQSEIDSRSTQAGRQVRQQAQDLRSVAEQLRSQGKDAPARAADEVARRVERTGQWLTQADADRLLHDIEDFGRRNPWAVTAGGLALGLVASRFLKASSRQRFERALPEHASAGYGSRAGERFTRAAAGSSGLQPPAPPSGASY